MDWITFLNVMIEDEKAAINKLISWNTRSAD